MIQVDITEAERRVLVELLHSASRTFGNRGCSDFDVSELGMNPLEAKALWKKLHDANESHEEDREYDGVVFDDWWLMDYFADVFEEAGGVE